MRQRHGLRGIGVLGARGGAGATTLAAALAAQLAAERALGPVPPVLVDQTGGGGVDVVLGIEEIPGLRWADLHRARGGIVGAELLELMPTWGGVHVLSADRRRPGPVPAEVRNDVLIALAAAARCVFDLGAPEPDALARCDHVLLVVPRDLRSIAGAQSILARLDDAGVPREDVSVVVRGPAPGGLDPDRVARVLGAPLLAHFAPDRGLDAAVEQGAGPQGRRIKTVARRIVRELLLRPAPTLDVGSATLGDSQLVVSR